MPAGTLSDGRIMSWYPKVSPANKIPGSRMGSQRPQARGDTGPRPAIHARAAWHVGPCPAPPGHTSKVPPKQ